MAKISISIPAYNDSQTIESLANESLAALSAITDDYEVFIINDGSKDATSEVIRKLSRENPRIKIFEHQKNLGFGATIREVYTLPDSEWIFFIPGDAQIAPSEIIKLFPFKDKYQFILGYRKHRNDPWMRKINSWCYNTFISMIAGKMVRDVNSVGLLKRDALNGVSLNSASAFIHAEILLEIIRKGASFTEIEILHKPRSHGSGSGNKWRTIFSTMNDMLKYCLGRFRRKSPGRNSQEGV